MRTESAFLKAELLTSAARDLLGREVHLACPQEAEALRAAVLCRTPRFHPAQPWQAAAAQLPALAAGVSCCAAYSHIPARSV